MANSEITTALSQNGYAVVTDFISQNECACLVDDLRELQRAGRFKRAGVGRGQDHSITDQIRRDEICWFEQSELRSGQKLLWEKLEQLRLDLNTELFLGLWDLEGHFAIYAPGGFYKKHVDRFQSSDLRAVSAVLYLNQTWQPGDGGELVIYRDGSSEIVEPRAGTFVCFLSDQIEHEVRESFTERLSFAGWFRRRGT